MLKLNCNVTILWPVCVLKVFVIKIYISVYIKAIGMTWGFVTCGPNEALVISGTGSLLRELI